jgi:hypothetical protein
MYDTQIKKLFESYPKAVNTTPADICKSLASIHMENIISKFHIFHYSLLGPQYEAWKSHFYIHQKDS